MLLATVFALLLIGTTSPPDGTIRVRVLEEHRPQTVIVQSERDEVEFFLDEGERPILLLKPGQQATLSANDGDVRMEATGQSFTVPRIRITTKKADPLRIEVPSIQGRPVQRAYPGALVVEPTPQRANNLLLINYVDLETYVASVITHEYGFEDVEGAKAMAVAIRTYALFQRQKGHDTAFDQVDHTGSQVYRGVQTVMPIAEEAARQTRGQVLSYDGQLIEAVYSAANGGQTASNVDIWAGVPLPYLRNKKDPYDQSKHDSWTSNVPRSGLLQVLSRHTGSQVHGIKINKPKRSKRVSYVRLMLGKKREKSIPAIQFRQIVTQAYGMNALKSTWFSVERKGDTYQFKGHGFGHGVGLSQWGTLRMSERGFRYPDILAFYYPKTRLQHVNDLGTQRIVEAPTQQPEVIQEKPAKPKRKSRRRVGW